MLSTQLNHLVDSGTIERHKVIKLTGFASNTVQGRRLLIILTVEPVDYSSDKKIGEPKAIESGAGAGASAGAAGGDANANAQAPKIEANKPSVGGFSAGAGVPAARGAGGMSAGSRGGRGGAGGAGSAGGRSGNGGPTGPLFPIEGLSPYQNKWTIKARVINRSDIKHWSNQKGEGKLFSVTLMDESGEIRATGFNEAVDNFYELLSEGKVFYISRARVNIAKKQFSNVNNEYELTLDNNTEVSPCDDDAVPQIKYKFTPIDQLGNHEKDEILDVLAVVKDVGELGSINSKATQKPFSKRDITLVDQTQHSVRLTLWGKQAESFNGEGQPVIAFKGVKLGDFGGRSLSMYSSSTMSLNPDIPEAHALRGWFDVEGSTAEFASFSNTGMGGAAGAGGAAGNIRPEEVKTIGEVKDQNIGTSDKMEYFTTKATISFIKNDTFAYPACDSEGCQKKVVDIGGGWRCEKCDKTIDRPQYR